MLHHTLSLVAARPQIPGYRLGIPERNGDAARQGPVSPPRPLAVAKVPAREQVRWTDSSGGR